MIGTTYQRESRVPERKRGYAVSGKRISVGKRAYPMHYEGGRPEPNPTVRDIYAAWALVGAILLALILLSFA
jgi:hypothetical protein